MRQRVTVAQPLPLGQMPASSPVAKYHQRTLQCTPFWTDQSAVFGIDSGPMATHEAAQSLQRFKQITTRTRSNLTRSQIRFPSRFLRTPNLSHFRLLIRFPHPRQVRSDAVYLGTPPGSAIELVQPINTRAPGASIEQASRALDRRRLKPCNRTDHMDRARMKLNGPPSRTAAQHTRRAEAPCRGSARSPFRGVRSPCSTRLPLMAMMGCFATIVSSSLMAQMSPDASDGRQNISLPVKDDLSRAPDKVDIKPVARDEEISTRLQLVLKATGWFTAPQGHVGEGVVFLNGRVNSKELKKWAGDLAEHAGYCRRGQRDGADRTVGVGLDSGMERSARPLARLNPIAPLFPLWPACPGTYRRCRRAGDPRSMCIPASKRSSESAPECDCPSNSCAGLPLRRLHHSPRLWPHSTGINGGWRYDDSINDPQNVARNVMAEHPAVLKAPEPSVLANTLGPSTVNPGVYFWLLGRTQLAEGTVFSNPAAQACIPATRRLHAGRGPRGCLSARPAGHHVRPTLGEAPRCCHHQTGRYATGH